MSARKRGWYRAHFITGTVDFQEINLGEASQLAKSLGAEHYPGERMISVGAVSVRTREDGKRKRVKS